jgi:transcriptional regulator GlxA family with amidase domain
MPVFFNGVALPYRATPGGVLASVDSMLETITMATEVTRMGKYCRSFDLQPISDPTPAQESSKEEER